MEGIVCLCRLSWSFLFWQGRIEDFVLNCDKGSDFMYAYRFGVGIFMMSELWQMDMWYLLITGMVIGKLVSAFCRYLWLMHPSCRIGLLMLTLGVLVQLNLLQRYGLVVGCYVLY